MEEGQTIQWPKEKGQNDKQRSTKHNYMYVEQLITIWQEQDMLLHKHPYINFIRWLTKM
jgi:hypothetical protein